MNINFARSSHFGNNTIQVFFIGVKKNLQLKGIEKNNPSCWIMNESDIEFLEILWPFDFYIDIYNRHFDSLEIFERKKQVF